jgi:hypothetical protein
MDAARDTEHDQPEPQTEPVEQHDIPTLQRTIAELKAALHTERAAREAPPTRWLTIKAAAHRATIGAEQMRRTWAKRGWVVSKRGDGAPILIDEASIDVHLARLGRKPVTFR